eukprot:PhF_6_TR20504/c0_g1_i1/m.29551
MLQLCHPSTRHHSVSRGIRSGRGLFRPVRLHGLNWLQIPQKKEEELLPFNVHTLKQPSFMNHFSHEVFPFPSNDQFFNNENLRIDQTEMNTKFQKLMEEPWQSVPEAFDWSHRYESLLEEFRAKTYQRAERAVMEGNYENFIENGVMYEFWHTDKFPTFHFQQVDIIKIARQEHEAYSALVKLLRVGYNQKRPHTFSVPLSYLLTHCGCRVTVTAAPPLQLGKVLDPEDHRCSAIRDWIAKGLRLKIRDDGILSSEMKFFQASDDRIYLLHCGLLLPATRVVDTTTAHYLGNRFRIEYLQQADLILNPDAGTLFNHPNRMQDDQEVVRSTARLMSKTIHDVVDLMKNSKYIGKGEELCKLLHRKGVNLRYMGILAEGLVKELGRLDSTNPACVIPMTQLAQFLNACKEEMISRAFCEIVCETFAPLHPLTPQRELEVANELTSQLLLLGRHTKTNLFWLETLLPRVQKKFDFHASVSYRDVSRRNIRLRTSVLLGWSIEETEYGGPKVLRVSSKYRKYATPELPLLSHVKGSVLEAAALYESEAFHKTHKMPHLDVLLRFGEVLIAVGQTRHREAESILCGVLKMNYDEIVVDHLSLYRIHSILGSLYAMKYRIADAVNHFEKAVSHADIIHYDPLELIDLFGRFVLVLKEIESEKGRAIHYLERCLVIFREQSLVDPVTFRRVRFNLIELLTSTYPQEFVPPNTGKMSYGKFLLESLNEFAFDALREGDLLASKCLFGRQLLISTLYFGKKSLLTAFSIDNVGGLGRAIGNKHCGLLLESYEAKVACLSKLHAESLFALLSYSGCLIEDRKFELARPRLFEMILTLRLHAEEIYSEDISLCEKEAWNQFHHLGMTQNPLLERLIQLGVELSAKWMDAESDLSAPAVSGVRIAYGFYDVPLAATIENLKRGLERNGFTLMEV